jgi:hypothetical protein
MRSRIVPLVLTPVLAALALVAAAPSAPALPPYQNQCATLSLSTTTPAVGAQLGVSGRFYEPGAHVTIVMNPHHYVLGHVTANAQGEFSVEVQLPAGVTGRFLVDTSGGRAPDCPADPISIQIGSNGTGGTSGGGTAMTGVDVARLLAIALGLLGIGYLLNERAGVRRRRAARAARYEARHRAAH